RCSRPGTLFACARAITTRAINGARSVCAPRCARRDSSGWRPREACRARRDLQRAPLTRRAESLRTACSSWAGAEGSWHSSKVGRPSRSWTRWQKLSWPGGTPQTPSIAGPTSWQSAGLDRYAYEYETGEDRMTLGESPVRLRCAVKGAMPVPHRLPQVVGRRELDLAPVDITDPAAVRRLEAWVWVDQPERLERL